MEYGSIDEVTPSVTGTYTRRYDSRTGFGTIYSIEPGARLFGQYGGLQFSNDTEDGSFAPSLNISPNLVAFLTRSSKSESEGGQKTENEDKRSTVEIDAAGSFKQSLDRMVGNARMPNLFASREFSLSSPTIVPLSSEDCDIDDIGFGLDIAVGTIGTKVKANIGMRANVSQYKLEEFKTLIARGYLRSDEAEAEDLMDYGYERDIPFLLKDDLLPIPYSNADIFRVSGGGSFRAFNRNPGTFHQNAVSSTIEMGTKIPNGIVDLGPPFGFGVGHRWGDGTIMYESGSWDDPEAASWSSFTGSGDEPWFFRYTHDRGGSLLFDDDDKAVRANLTNRDGAINEALDFFGINDYSRFPVPPTDIQLQLEDWERPGRNGYIGFTHNSEMLESVNNKFYKSYNKVTESRDAVEGRSEENMSEQIGEFALYGSGGSRYVYGLPVYAKNEKSMQLGLRDIKLKDPNSVDRNLLAYKSIDQHTVTTAIGQEMKDQYATSWLLTEITTPDYVDLTGDGPTEDDFGGWTKFHYKLKQVGTTKWDYWRQPFSGLSYNAVELSDPGDDIGSYAEGERQRYYLDRVETKTHVALFMLNDVYTDHRNDGYLPRNPDTRSSGIPASDYAAGSSIVNPTNFSIYHQAPRYLKRIELYTKDETGEPDVLLSTVYFEYDYSLRKNMPSSLLETETDRYGLLTLRKVWGESRDVKNATIHPTIFGYEYKESQDYATDVQTKYPAITAFADNLTPEMQNPEYNPYDFDAWGYYRPGGTDRLDNRVPYVPQDQVPLYDPAAWQLKTIRSPSGGELHIQYEEDEYAYVQDRPALAMVSLIDEVEPGGFDISIDDGHQNKYFLNLTDIDVDVTDLTQVKKVKELIEKEAKRNNRLFFRFLYALKGNNPSITSPEYNSDYIAGYAELDDVDYETINPGPNEWYALYVKLIGREDNNQPHDHGVPKKVCKDYVKKRKHGKLGKNDGVEYTDNDLKLAWRLRGKHSASIDYTHCEEVDYANSYIRIPILNPKRGGGLRVKRLLSYDPGVEATGADAALYGTEYRYEQYDPERNEVISSGVAANEPSSISDENPLFAYEDLTENEAFSEGKIAAGRDRARNEGLIGRQLLPSASIGYARVATHPIHQGTTATGFSVTDYLTHREYPYDAVYPTIGSAVDYTYLDPDEFKTSPLFRNLIIYKQYEHLVFATQGFRFVKTDLPGKVRRQLVNGGSYTPYERDWLTSASTENIYYQPGEEIPLLYRFGDPIQYGYPGKEMEVVHASRQNGAYIDQYTSEGDVTVYLPFPPSFMVSGAGYYSVNNSQLSTHTTTKVISYPATLKGVLSFADGNYNYVENVAFDPRSGSPIVTRSRDAFDGLDLQGSPGGHVGTYHSYGVPLVNQYPELGSIAGNERSTIGEEGEVIVEKGSDVDGAYLDFPGGSQNRWMKKLTPGDFVELTLVTPQNNETDAGRYHITSVEGTVVRLAESANYNNTNEPAFARIGEVTLDVVRSGRANAPGLVLGGVTTYGETPDEVELGTNVTWTGGDISKRLALVSQLNAIYGDPNIPEGTSTSFAVDGTLEIEPYGSSQCTTASGLTWTLTKQGGTITITSSGYTDVIEDQGNGGEFDLDDGGQIVFRSTGNLSKLGRPRVNPLEQRVLNFTFCSDDPPHRAVSNVIAGSAGTISDEIEYETDIMTSNGSMNDYEQGSRGRWSPRTAYVYRTDVVSSNPVAGERVYKDGGVFDDFSLFNWSEPESSDMDHWVQLDQITHINRHNVPYGSIDPLGRSSITIFDYGSDRDLLPVLSAWNAEEGTVVFESFEFYGPNDIQGDVSDNTSHAGTNSIKISSGNTSNYGVQVRLNDHLLAKGCLLRFWSTNDANEIHLQFGHQFPSAVIPEKIARVGEWTLYEAEVDGSSIAGSYVSGDDIAIWFTNTSGSEVWIDDVKFQPADAMAGASVFDPVTFQPLAGFDDQNFGIYPVYDGRSAGYASMVETSRGLFTVGDVHGHVPGARRDWLGEGSQYHSGTTFGGVNQSSMFEGNPSDLSGETTRPTFELLDLQLGLSDQNVEIFGVDPGELRKAVEGRLSNLSDATPEQLQLVNRYEELRDQYESLKAKREEASTEEAKAEIEAELKELQSEQENLLQQLNIEQ